MRLRQSGVGVPCTHRHVFAKQFPQIAPYIQWMLWAWIAPFVLFVNRGNFIFSNIGLNLLHHFKHHTVRINFTQYNVNLSTRFTPEAGITLPDGWVPAPLTEDMRKKHFYFYATNQQNGGTVLMRARPRAGVSSMMEFAELQRTSTSGNLIDASATEIAELQVQGLPAWRFEVQGLLKTNRKDVTSITTIIDAGKEIVEIDIPMQTSYFADAEEDMLALTENVTGLDAFALQPNAAD